MKKFVKILYFFLILSFLLLFTAAPVFAAQEEDLALLQDTLEKNIEQANTLLEHFEKGDPLEEIKEGLEELIEPELSLPEEGETSSNQITASLYSQGNDLTGLQNGASGNISLLFAQLQMELAQQNKEIAINKISEVQKIQQEQNDTSACLSTARQLQNEAKAKNTAIAMPPLLESFLQSRGLSYSPTATKSYTSDQWQIIINRLEAYQEQLGSDVQRQMIYIQDYMSQYNSYLTGANSAISSANETLTALARGQSLFSQQGGILTAPFAASLAIGLLAGMGLMYLFLRRKLISQSGRQR